MKTFPAQIVSMFVTAAALASPPPPDTDVALSGFMKSLWSMSFGVDDPFADPWGRVVRSTTTSSTSNVVRVRLDARPARFLSLEAAWEGLAAIDFGGGSIPAMEHPGFSRGAAFGWGTRTGAAPIQADLSTGPSHLVAHRVDRLAATFNLGRARLVIGRQAVTWGAGRFFSPTDLVHPFRPLQIDREVKPGADAIAVAWSVNPETRWTVLAAALGPDDRPFPGRWLAGTHLLAQAGPVALSLVAAYRDDPAMPAGEFVGGGSAEMDPLGIGLRLEGTWTRPARRGRAGFVQAVASADYTFRSGLHVLAEYYHNGNGAGSAPGYPGRLLDHGFANGEVASLGSHEVVFLASYPWRDLTFETGVIANPLDPSALICPRVTWTASDAAEVQVGAWMPAGRGLRWGKIMPEGPPVVTGIGSEYGALPRTAYVLAKFYF